MRLPVGAVAQAERLDPALRALAERQRLGVVGAEQQQAAPRNQVHEPLKRQADRREVGIDVRVIELDVVDDGDVRQVLQELGGLVEEGAVVLVAFDHELAAAADAIAAFEVLGDAADEHARVGSAVRQQPPRQRRGRRLPVGAGDDDRPCAPEEMIADRLGQRAIPNLPVEHLLELDVAARDGIADDHQIDIGRDVGRVVALERGDALVAQEVAHRRIDVLVRAAHVEAAALQQRRQRRHGRSADANQVNTCHDSVGPRSAVHSTAASSMTSDGRSPASTEAAIPSGSVRRGTVRVARLQPIEYRTAEIRQHAPDGVPGGRASARLVAPGQRVEDDGGGASQQAAQSQLREHPIQPIRPLRHVVEEQDRAGRRIERVRRAERCDQLRQRPANQHAAGLARPHAFRGDRRESLQSAPPATRCAERSRGRSLRLPARSGLRSSVRETTRGRTPASARSAAMCCRCSRRTPSAARAPRRRRARAAAARCHSHRARQ